MAKLFFYLTALLVVVHSSGCAENIASSTASTGGDTTQLPPVETSKANTSYQPAFNGQTRIAAVKTVTPYNVEKIAEVQQKISAKLNSSNDIFDTGM